MSTPATANSKGDHQIPNVPSLPPPNPAYMYTDETKTTQPDAVHIVLNTPGREPLQTVCQSCQTKITTNLKHEAGLFAWLSAGCCCITGLWCGCCCAPFMCDGFKDVTHVCPDCGATVAEKSRI